MPALAQFCKNFPFVPWSHIVKVAQKLISTREDVSVDELEVEKYWIETSLEALVNQYTS